MMSLIWLWLAAYSSLRSRMARLVSISAMYHSRFISSIFSFQLVNRDTMEDRPPSTPVTPPTMSPENICPMPVPMSIMPSTKVIISPMDCEKRSPNTAPRESPQPRIVDVSSFPFSFMDFNAPDTSPSFLTDFISSSQEVLKALKGLPFSSSFCISFTRRCIRSNSATVTVTCFFTNLPSASLAGTERLTPLLPTLAPDRVS